MRNRSFIKFDTLDLLVTYIVTGATWILVSSMDIAPSQSHNHGTCRDMAGLECWSPTAAHHRSIRPTPTSLDYDGPNETTSFPWSSYTLKTTFPAEDELCCSGVLGYASDNASSNFPCQRRPCCNVSEIQAVLSVDQALGFRFQCMPRTSIEVLCYENGVEVRTSNQDPDYIPRACCPGLKFEVILNQWYAALVIKCVEMDAVDKARLESVTNRRPVS